jgi:pilus assembly protein CpaE
MNEGERASFICVGREEHGLWLMTALKDVADIIVADTDELNHVLQLVDLSGASIVLLSLTQNGQRRELALIEGLMAAKPLLGIIAVADHNDQAALLAAIRAGARDFVTTDTRSSELIAIIQRVANRTQLAEASPNNRLKAWSVAVLSARPGYDAPMFAMHAALALQAESPANKTLLLDLGLPAADTLTFLGVKPSYNFGDLLRSLRRMDQTLIDTAFGRHKSGLYLVGLPEDPRTALQEMSSADVFILLSALCRHFTHLVINLGGVQAPEFLSLFINRVDSVVVVGEQSVPSCKHNRALLQKLRDGKANLSHASVVVDRYLDKLPPDADSIAKGLELPLLGTLPPSGVARMMTLNSGESMFDATPRDPYPVKLKKLVMQMLGASAAAAQPGALNAKSLFGKLMAGLR